jgi:hypothetical protein
VRGGRGSGGQGGHAVRGDGADYPSLGAEGGVVANEMK